ncbi:MAG: NAD(P)/FAD-dependent oxidoreductase [Firmicutes bacterium]|nr:NAD(P)/FAD-dependent oxidoreductase [Bacillota bacterium]
MRQGNAGNKYDVVVVGGGIVGTMIAREMSRYRLKVALLEKELDVGVGSTKANSAIVHAGFDAEPGTLKASLNVKGTALFPSVAEELGVEFAQTGSLVVAVEREEIPALEELVERGRLNGVRGLEVINGDRLFLLEPNLNRAAVAALHATTAGITCPFRLAIAAAENAVTNGVALYRGCPVTGVLVDRGAVRAVATPLGEFGCDYLVNAAGLHADEVARLAGDDSLGIRPRRGEYHVLDKSARALVRTVVFPVPSKVSKGIIVAPTIDGNIIVGPNAEDIRDKEDTATTAAGLREVLAGAARLVPAVDGALPPITQYSGLRAVEKGGDFVVTPSTTVRGLVNVAGIQSPGLSAAPAIAPLVVEILREMGLRTVPNPAFNPERKPPWRFAGLCDAERSAAVERDRDCGHIVCRCESVTRAEVLAAIRGPVGALTLDGIKRRTRAGMGRCQGGFCTPRILSITAQEMGQAAESLLKSEPGSPLVAGLTRPEAVADWGD